MTRVAELNNSSVKFRLLETYYDSKISLQTKQWLCRLRLTKDLLFAYEIKNLLLLALKEFPKIGFEIYFSSMFCDCNRFLWNTDQCGIPSSQRNVMALCKVICKVFAALSNGRDSWFAENWHIYWKLAIKFLCEIGRSEVWRGLACYSNHLKTESISICFHYSVFSFISKLQRKLKHFYCINRRFWFEYKLDSESSF